MKAPPLKLGFIGGGINSAVGTTHFIASQMDSRFDVVSGCFSRNKEVNQITAEKWGVSRDRTYNNYLDLIKQEGGELDAVVILTPTPDHIDSIIPSLQGGLSVICEKALTVSSSHAQDIIDVKKANDSFLAVTYNYTGYPMLRELKQIIADGRLGKLLQLHIEMPQEGFLRTNQDGTPVVPQEWRLHDNQLPTVHLDLGVHVHNIISFLTGEKPKELIATNSTKGNFPDIIDNTLCLASYTNSLECNIWFSKCAIGYRNGLRLRVFGQDGSAEWCQMNPEHLILNDQRGHKSIIDRSTLEVGSAQQPLYNRFKAGHPAGFIEAFANYYNDLADSLTNFKKTGIQEKSSYVFTAKDALEGLLMLEAMTESSRKKSWVKLGSNP